jgi:hypothetical protein
MLVFRNVPARLRIVAFTSFSLFWPAGGILAPSLLRASKPGALAHFSARIAAGPHRFALFCFKVSAVVLPNRAV